jgi:hypothetical protein
VTHPLLGHPRAAMFTPRPAHSRRASSWDRTGANRDYIKVEPGETAVLLDHDGPGCLTHIYIAMVLPDITDYRDAILRCYWDRASRPSVEVPLGDFFGVVHGRVRDYQSAMTAVNGGLGGASHGMNAYFPMPFSDCARVTLEQRGLETLGGALGNLWYHIDYEAYDDPIPGDVLRFHASYRQERPTSPVGPEHNLTLHDAPNLDGAENFVALDTRGSGRMVGLVLEVDNAQGNHWYGEGDDMVFVDGETWPPSIHGTGSEEIFGAGACPTDEYAGPYTGFHLIESADYDGLVGMYRWYVDDPIHFAESLRWTIEHGHANNFANDYAAVAYWYQAPLAELSPLPGRDEMVPPLGNGYKEAKAALFERTRALRSAVAGGAPLIEFLRACRAGRHFFRGNWQATLDEISRSGGGP